MATESVNPPTVGKLPGQKRSEEGIRAYTRPRNPADHTRPMPEGPSIVILRELAEGFAGKRVLDAGGSTRTIDPARMQGLAVRRVASWGKHFLLQFDGFALRVHFMLYGSYAIDGGKPGRVPRLHLGFARGRSLDVYACSLRYVEGDIDDNYDFRIDVMNAAWSPRLALKALRARPDALACDALLEQDVFAGVGNIIKNEVLFRVRVHPESRIGALPTTMSEPARWGRHNSIAAAVRVLPMSFAICGTRGSRSVHMTLFFAGSRARVTPSATIIESQSIGAPFFSAAAADAAKVGDMTRSRTISTMPHAWTMRTATRSSSGERPERSASARMIENERA